jgi:type II pantothenate kinase
MIKVSGPQQFERIGGSSVSLSAWWFELLLTVRQLGGGTLWGLLSLLTPAKSFDGLPLTVRGLKACVDQF